MLCINLGRQGLPRGRFKQLLASKVDGANGLLAFPKRHQIDAIGQPATALPDGFKITGQDSWACTFRGGTTCSSAALWWKVKQSEQVAEIFRKPRDTPTYTCWVPSIVRIGQLSILVAIVYFRTPGGSKCDDEWCSMLTELEDFTTWAVYTHTHTHCAAGCGWVTSTSSPPLLQSNVIPPRQERRRGHQR